jgi:hypothetical protein
MHDESAHRQGPEIVPKPFWWPSGRDFLCAEAHVLNVRSAPMLENHAQPTHPNDFWNPDVERDVPSPQVSLQATFFAIFRHFLYKAPNQRIELFSEIECRDMDKVL